MSGRDQESTGEVPSPEEVDRRDILAYRDISDEIFSSIAGKQEDQSRAFQEAAHQVERAAGYCRDENSSREREERALEEWAIGRKSLVPAEWFRRIQLISADTAEHQVFFDGANSRAIKRTLAGFYGQIPIPERGRLERRVALPSEYLRRMALQVAVFGDDIDFVGVTKSDEPSMIIGQPSGQPSLVISQGWHSLKEAPSMEEVAQRMRADGFESVPKSHFGWYRPADGVVVTDAKPDNFVKLPEGIVPIDLQMSIFTPMELKAAGLKWIQASTAQAFGL